MTSGKQRVIERWVGFTDGKPDEYPFPEPTDLIVLETYRNKKNAERRYQDVRKVRITWWEDQP